MKVSKNFDREEFACKCGCGFCAVDVELVGVLEVVRERFNSPVAINSACRCDLHNTSVGGNYESKHKKGIAADIVVKGVDPEEVYNFLDNHAGNKYGVGMYSTFTHIDVRERKARWRG